ncbi:basement membrane-specific heparan sulfate proteoglycan core protein [Elysia marginata]|uniref:Basement membrane-specific heparan sulfate proteoglycan core protein n=1 Tax=Elysia marginata TaxID=1093978 RepID=A0AAV4F4S7_9GAST|nr:basement membrane-specific heparan sulfate proteoglycan core protein [Elysia marginata]
MSAQPQKVCLETNIAGASIFADVQDFDFDIEYEPKMVVKRATGEHSMMRKVPDDEDMLSDDAGSGPDEGSGEPPLPEPEFTTRFYRVTITAPQLFYLSSFQDRSSAQFMQVAKSYGAAFSQTMSGQLNGEFDTNIFALEQPSQQCPEYVGREPTPLPRGGDNWLNLLINNAFPCDGEVTGWEYYRLDSQATAYVGVWRLLRDGRFQLIGKTELPPAAIGVQRVDVANPISVETGDFIGIFYSTSSASNIIAQATMQDNAVPVEQMYQNYRVQIFDEDITQGSPFSVDNYRLQLQNATFALRAAVSYPGDAGDGGSIGTVGIACDKMEFDCGDGHCISTSYLCDGQVDCNNGVDERECTSCQPGLFLCGNGVCITETFRCDGREDCDDGTDEQDCSKLSSSLYWCYLYNS